MNGLIKDINKFISELDSTNDCGKFYCTTCGGLAHKIQQNASEELIRRINIFLNDLSLTEFLQYHELREVFKTICPDEVKGIILREAQSIDVGNARELDDFLLHFRRDISKEDIYKRLVVSAIDKALNEDDDSLVETLVIVLGEDIMSHPQLFEFAVSKISVNRDIHRALYNTVRHCCPDVRGFIGDGSTSFCW